MKLEYIFIIAVILHILCCVLIYLGSLVGLLKVRRIMAIVALFMPVWGEVLVLILHFRIFLKQTDNKELDVEKFHVESELYKGINYDESQRASSTVSMEEALIVNTPKERRAIIMDVLNDNEKSYVEFLKLAGNNEDTEVVHYAVTAMVQISKENDSMLWELEQKYADDPDDPETIAAYCEFLWHCIEQGLMQGQAERSARELFDTLSQKKIKTCECELSDYTRCILNCLVMKNYTEAGIMLERAEDKWKRREELILLRIQYYADLEDAASIKKLIGELDENDVYLSGRAKEVIAFWK